MRCASCSGENPEGFRFCGHCSAPLAVETAAAEQVRKTVTVVFSDVTGSTAMGERLDPEAVRNVMARYFGEMRAVLEAHGGTVEKFIGDAVMAVFGVPVVHEDDALRAVRAAHEMRERLAVLNKDLERDHGVAIVARTGVNTGEVVVGSGIETIATGDAVNVAARLEQAAPPGEILIGADTLALVRDAVEVEAVEPVEARGKSQPLNAFLLRAVTGGEGLARRFDLPLVGRQAELAALDAALRTVEHERSCVLATVVGPAGVGKSRLVQEFVTRVAVSASVVRGRCLSYGAGITFWPIVEILTAAIGDVGFDPSEELRARIASRLRDDPERDLVAERLSHLLGMADAGAGQEETHWAVRRFLQAMAASAPLIVVFEDLHWAEPALLDLLEYVAVSSRDAPILLLGTTRPDLFERRPTWGSGSSGGATVVLEPLSDADASELVANLLERSELPAQARRRIVETAEGNALFVEHMVATLIEDGSLRRQDGRWVVARDLADHLPPASVMALLGARLDRLPERERGLLERAAVEGTTFHVGSLRHLDPDDASLTATLLTLVRRDLIRPDRSAFAGEDAFAFRHVLIRDAAYQRVAKATRAEWHERHAAWLELTAGDRLPELEEIVAYHLERAYELRSELSPADEAAGAIAERAVRHLTSSGRRAADRGDARAASNLLARAASLLGDDDPRRVRVLGDLSNQLLNAGETSAARDAVEQAELALGTAPSPSDEIAASYARLILDGAMDPQGVPERMEDVARRLTPLLEELRDDAGLAKAWTLLGNAELWRGNSAGLLVAFERALDHAERAGDSIAASQAVEWCLIATYGGPIPVDEAFVAVEALARRASNNLETSAWARIARGRLLGLVGRIDEGRTLVRNGQETFRELGLDLTVGGSSMEVAALDLIAGDFAAAERILRAGCEILERLGEKGYLSTAWGWLGRCVARAGGLDEAERLALASADVSATQDVYSQAGWRQALALVNARRGHDDRALALALEAIDLSEGTDDCLARTAAFEDLADVHRLAGRADDEASALRRAIAVWEAKGATAPVERLRASLAG